MGRVLSLFAPKHGGFCGLFLVADNVTLVRHTVTLARRVLSLRKNYNNDRRARQDLLEYAAFPRGI